MRIAALILLSLTVACTTDYEGLGWGTGGGAGSGRGGGPPAGEGGRGGVAPAAGGAAGLGGAGGAAGAAGMGVAGNGAGGAAGAGGGGNQAGGGGGQGQTGGAGGSPKLPGQTCASGAECATGFCFDGTCCRSDCSGACRSCANDTGTCTLAPARSDPRNDCPADLANPCGRVGACNGTGACALAPPLTVCQSAPTCDAAHAAVIPSAKCNGAGTCLPDAPVSCHGFLCSAGACGTLCGDDGDCAGGAFCSATTCVSSVNLAGNGDLETGTLTGWSPLAGGTLSLSSAHAHAGQFSVALSDRNQTYQGPSYALPTGLGRYTIGVWAMQMGDTSAAPPQLVAQIRLVCLSSTAYVTVPMGGAGMSAAAGTWLHYAADVDLTTDPAVAPDCFADGPGLVKSATLFIDQLDPGATIYPDLYADDLTVVSTDGHNLIGNPNFEAGVSAGWIPTGGTSTLDVSNGTAHAGHGSLWQSNRTLPTSAVTYALPLGAARYLTSLWVMQSGTTTHQLALLPLYSCIGSTVVHFGAPSAAVTAAAGQWTQLSAAFVFPPAGAPAGCVLSQAAVALGQAETGTCGDTVECPDLFVDDASITLK